MKSENRMTYAANQNLESITVFIDVIFSKTSASCFTEVSKHEKQMKAQGH